MRRLHPLFCSLLLAACSSSPSPQPPPARLPPTLPLRAPAPAPTEVAITPPAPPPSPPSADPLPESEPEPGPTLPARPYLAANIAARFPRRARLARSSPVRLTLNGPRFGDNRTELLLSPLEAVVVEEHPRSLRVVVDNGAVRLVLFAPRSSFHMVSTRAVWLALAPDRAADPAAGAQIAPGVALDEIANQFTLHRVRGEASGIAFEGWLPEEAIGVSFVPRSFSAGGAEGLVAESTAITNAAGEIIARLPPPLNKAAPPSFTFDVSPLAGAPTGFQAIHLRLPDIEIKGLVPSASYQKKPPRTGTSVGQIGGGIGFMGSMSDTEHALLRKGAQLLDDAGEPVGIALVESDVFMGAVPIADKSPLRSAWLLISPFGFCDFQVRKADLRPLRR